MEIKGELINDQVSFEYLVPKNEVGNSRYKSKEEKVQVNKAVLTPRDRGTRS